MITDDITQKSPSHLTFLLESEIPPEVNFPAEWLQQSTIHRLGMDELGFPPSFLLTLTLGVHHESSEKKAPQEDMPIHSTPDNMRASSILREWKP